jgi:hypothetical protein
MKVINKQVVYTIELTDEALKVIVCALGITSATCRRDAAKVAGISLEPEGLGEKLHNSLYKLVKSRKR